MEGLQDSLQKIQLFFPAGCFTLFQYAATQITTNGACDDQQQHVMVATIAVLAAVAFAMAIWQRHQGQTQHLSQARNFSLNLLRAVSSAVAFTALALFTTPAPTCLFPDYSRPGGTKIPPWLQSYVLAILAAGLSALSAAVPGFVTDPPPPDHLPLASGPAATGTTRGTA